MEPHPQRPRPRLPLAADALEKLCRSYWPPLYAYVRRRGFDEQAAQDLTQGFFARLLEKNYLAQAERDQGRFRSFLLASLKHFLSDEWDKARAQKRGGGQTPVSLDDPAREDRPHLEPADVMDAEKIFERQWALTLLEQARSRLADEYAQAGQSPLYARLRAVEAGDPDAPSYAQTAAELGLSENAVKSQAFRMRKRYRELVREQVAQTVGHPAEIDGEIRHLIAVISG